MQPSCSFVRESRRRKRAQRGRHCAVDGTATRVRTIMRCGEPKSVRASCSRPRVWNQWSGTCQSASPLFAAAKRVRRWFSRMPAQCRIVERILNSAATDALRHFCFFRPRSTSASHATRMWCLPRISSSPACPPVRCVISLLAAPNTST